VREIPLYFYVLMFPCSHEKIKEERDRSGKFNKTRRKEWRKEREEIFAYVEVPILVCSPLVGDALGLYNMNRFRTKVMKDYYITMESMFLVVKLYFHPSIGYANLAILLP
jgi:hypothetical protein